MKQLIAGRGSGIKISDFFKTYRYQLFLLLACLIGYFELTAFIFIPKWDNIDGFLPYRHIVGTWIMSGHIPLWNPYQLLGYPMHSDPQSGAWYPVVWVLSLINNYDFYSINIELTFHYFISGLGMFTLGRTLKFKDSIAFIMGLAYMFSGFMVGTSQIMVMIIGAAWLPFSINYLLKSLNKPTFRHLFMLAFVNFLMITGSYPAMTIILVYIYLIIASYYLYQYFKKRFSLKTILIVFGVQTAILLLLTGGYFYSIYEMMPYLTRAQGIPYTDTLFAFVGFPIQSFISFLFPYTTIAATDFFHSDRTMINGYFGLFSIVFIVYGLLFYKDKKLLISFLSGVVLVLIATGMQLPFHYFVYKILPGFNLFRHPAIFRIYAIFLFIITLGLSLRFYSTDQKRIKHISSVLKGAIIFFFMVVVIAAFRTNFAVMHDYFIGLIQFKEKSPLNLSGHLLIQSSIQFVFVCIAYLLARKTKLNTKAIVFLVFIDLFLATQLNAPRTIYYSIPFKLTQKYLNDKPIQLTNQTLDDNLISINNKNVKPKIRGVWNNLNSFAKRTAYDGYNPVKFNDFITLRESGIMNQILNNPLFYLPSKIYKYPTKEKIKDVSGLAFLSEDLYIKLKEAISKGDLYNLKIDYNGFSVRSTLTKKGLVFLLQNYHDNWHAYIDGKEVKIIKANIGLMAFNVPIGNHNIELIYRSLGSEIGLIISLLTLVIGFSFILFQWIKEKNSSIKSGYTKKRRP